MSVGACYAYPCGVASRILKRDVKITVRFDAQIDCAASESIASLFIPGPQTAPNESLKATRRDLVNINCE